MGFRRRALACLLVVAAPACGGDRDEPRPAPPGPRLTASVARELDFRLRESVADAGIPGASAAIVFRDGRVWRGAAGHAVVKPRRAMTPGTSLPLDSVTKLAAAALAMRLAEQGRLRLDIAPDEQLSQRASSRTLRSRGLGPRMRATRTSAS